MKYVNGNECIWNPTTDCLGCPYQLRCNATLSDITNAMWKENQQYKETLDKLRHIVKNMRAIISEEGN